MAAVVSVIIPAYNAAAYIRDCVNSIQTQTLSDWEMIIVDDGSNDRTAEILETIAQGDARITVMHQPNAGEASARATGVKHATSDIIYFLDADDLALPDTLERLVSALKNTPDVAAAYGEHLRVNAQGRLLYPKGRALNRTIHPKGDILLPLLKHPLFAIGAVAVRKSYMLDNTLSVNTNFAEDWVMWVRIALSGRFVFLGGAPLMKYRHHAASQTHVGAKLDEHMKAINSVFALPELQVRFTPQQLNTLRMRREAFCYFSLGCKELRRQDYRTAADFFRKSMDAGYRYRAGVWIVYLVARAGWMPSLIRRHLG